MVDPYEMCKRTYFCRSAFTSFANAAGLEKDLSQLIFVSALDKWGGGSNGIGIECGAGASLVDHLQVGKRGFLEGEFIVHHRCGGFD